MTPERTVADPLETLDDLYAALRPLSIGAGWLLRPPRSLGMYQSAHWRYRDCRSALDAAGRLIDTNLAERRNLGLMNPGGGEDICATLVTAYQMLLPGERARSHRHTQGALRFILDTEPGVYTIVDGVRLDMHPGDVVLTPGWCWHGHANESASQGYWIDYLDVPFVREIDQSLFEEYPGGYQAVTDIGSDSPLVYSWSDTKAALARASLEPSGRFGRRIFLDRYPLQRIGLTMSAIDAGTRTAMLKTSANYIYTVAEGYGRSVIDGTMYEWGRGDVFIAPSRKPHYHESEADAVLFCVSDEPLLAATGLLVEYT